MGANWPVLHKLSMNFEIDFHIKILFGTIQLRRCHPCFLVLFFFQNFLKMYLSKPHYYYMYTPYCRMVLIGLFDALWV